MVRIGASISAVGLGVVAAVLMGCMQAPPEVAARDRARTMMPEGRAAIKDGGVATGAGEVAKHKPAEWVGRLDAMLERAGRMGKSDGGIKPEVLAQKEVQGLLRAFAEKPEPGRLIELSSWLDQTNLLKSVENTLTIEMQSPTKSVQLDELTDGDCYALASVVGRDGDLHVAMALFGDWGAGRGKEGWRIGYTSYRKGKWDKVSLVPGPTQKRQPYDLHLLQRQDGTLLLLYTWEGVGKRGDIRDIKPAFCSLRMAQKPMGGAWSMTSSVLPSVTVEHRSFSACLDPSDTLHVAWSEQEALVENMPRMTAGIVAKRLLLPWTNNELGQEIDHRTYARERVCYRSMSRDGVWSEVERLPLIDDCFLDRPLMVWAQERPTVLVNVRPSGFGNAQERDDLYSEANWQDGLHRTQRQNTGHWTRLVQLDRAIPMKTDWVTGPRPGVFGVVRDEVGNWLGMGIMEIDGTRRALSKTLHIEDDEEYGGFRHFTRTADGTVYGLIMDYGDAIIVRLRGDGEAIGIRMREMDMAWSRQRSALHVEGGWVTAVWMDHDDGKTFLRVYQGEPEAKSWRPLWFLKPGGMLTEQIAESMKEEVKGLEAVGDFGHAVTGWMYLLLRFSDGEAAERLETLYRAGVNEAGRQLWIYAASHEQEVRHGAVTKNAICQLAQHLGIDGNPAETAVHRQAGAQNAGTIKQLLEAWEYAPFVVEHNSGRRIWVQPHRLALERTGSVFTRRDGEIVRGRGLTRNEFIELCEERLPRRELARIAETTIVEKSFDDISFLMRLNMLAEVRVLPVRGEGRR